ncbi:hypothetical protein PHISCL_04890 [Aspergillus sclerotialis]|uniref:Uncharacterized protein n=1 Tax=Aspergillus sclerotialis TaxID=2070753 RepID=A0A3A2ZN13_9EURO|nr:hypothetical protein PHISCL_04890 [Aspergillus sclerotialis]
MAYQGQPYYPARDRYDRPSNYDYYYPEQSYHGAMRRANDSIEEIPRPYPPGTPRYEYGYGYPPPRHSRVNTAPEDIRRSQSMGGGRGSYYEDDYYRPHRHRRSRRYDDRDRRDRYSRYSSPSSSRSPPRRRRKSISDQALGALGLGSAAESERGRSRSRHHRSHSYSPSSRGHKKKNEDKMIQAARAALLAGAVEAFRARKEPGEWTGEKGKRILTAALTSGAADGLVDKNPNKHSKRHLIESTLAGLATNHFVNGSRSRSRHGSRRSSDHSGLKNVAATGALAAAGKEAYDRFRSRSRGRSKSRGRSSSRDSYDDDASGQRGSRRRSKSVSDYINKGLAALGLDEGGDHKSRDRRGDRYDDYSDDDRYSPPRRSGRRHRRSARDDYSDEDRDVSYSPPPRYRDSRRETRDVGRRTTQPLYTTTKSGAEGKEGRGRPSPTPEQNNSSNDSDLGDSSDEKGKRKKLRRDTMLATGLASVATIHAAHEVYTSVEKRRKRMQQLKEGKITPEEARKSRLKSNLGDAASVGIALLGIKSAVSEWKEVDEKRKESSNFQRECRERAIKRERRRAKSHDPSSSSRRLTRYPDEIEEDGHRFPYRYYYDDNPYGVRSPSPEPQRISYY